jgi:RsiW-degrading membrane proteinase PrsW (M82 family)
MAIRFNCDCGKKLSAPDRYAGQEGKCSHCGKKFLIPGEPKPPVDETLLQQSSSGGVAVLTYQVNPKAVAKAAAPPRKARDYTYLVLLLALLPLFWVMFRQEDAGARLEKTLKNATPQAQARVDEIKSMMNIEGQLPEYVLPYLAEEEFDMLPGQNVFDGLPGGKIQGAMLARRSIAHWGFAAVSAVAFWALIQTFFPRKTAKRKHLFYVGFFTGTAGIVLLLIVQALADATRGWIPIPGGGLVVARGFFGFAGAVVSLIVWVFKLIAGSYDAALDPNSNFFVSAFGFMIGVGLLEEMIKAIPLLWYTNSAGTLSWRACIMWGLASGIGFGVSEGISYSADFYNGILAADIYVVRFISCVALHAIWSASVAVFIYQQRELVESAVTPWEWINAAFTVVIVSTFLHGLYDTMMKKELVLGGIIVAIVSVGVLGLQMEWLRKHGNKRKLAYGY